jgi:hypothetical protein
MVVLKSRAFLMLNSELRMLNESTCSDISKSARGILSEYIKKCARNFVSMFTNFGREPYDDFHTRTLRLFIVSPLI